MHLWRKWLFSYFTVFPTHWSIHKPFTQGATSTLKDPIGDGSNANFRQFWRDIQLYQLSLCSQASQAIDPSWKPPILIILTGPSPTCGWPTLRPHKTQDAGFFQACRNHPYNGSMIYAPEMRRGLSGGPTWPTCCSKSLGGLLSFTVFSSFSSSAKALVLAATGEGSKGLSLIICLTTYLWNAKGQPVGEVDWVKENTTTRLWESHPNSPKGRPASQIWRYPRLRY